ncbi:calcium-dependent protein serine/threonine phosphatase [Aureococcus anophagefferens]|nr:calcium-dependent protein serine/threonine phosphatase [Aureococcus anophagefferens]
MATAAARSASAARPARPCGGRRASTIEDRARRFDIPASSARVAAVDLAGAGGALSPADLRYKFACGEAVALDEVLRLLAAGRETMAAEPNVLRLAAPLVLVGDLHGQYADLMTVVHGGDAGLARARLRRAGERRPGPGPRRRRRRRRRRRAPVHLLRGNHESRACTGHFGFRAECRRKYGLGAYHEFCRVFEAMPLAAVIDCDFGKVFACHGGIGPDLKSIADLEALDRRAEPPDEGLLCDVLWADPSRGDAGGAADAWGRTPARLLRDGAALRAVGARGGRRGAGRGVGDEAHFVRQAYLVVPYMPTSFRSLVDTAKELLGLKSFLAGARRRRRPAPRGAAGRRRRAARGPKLEENRDPLAVSWADGVSGSPPAKAAPPPRPPPWRRGAPAATPSTSSPAAMRKRLAPSRGFAPPGIKAFLATVERGALAPSQDRDPTRHLRAPPHLLLFDADNTGAISREELALYAGTSARISPADVDVVFTVLDADGDKAVGLEEWTLFAAKLKAGWALAALPDSAAKSPAA